MSGTQRVFAASRGWPTIERAIEFWAQITEPPTQWLARLIYAKDRYSMTARDLVETVRDYLFGLGLDLTDPLLRITPACWSSYDEEGNHLVVGFGTENTIGAQVASGQAGDPDGSCGARCLQPRAGPCLSRLVLRRLAPKALPALHSTAKAATVCEHLVLALAHKNQD